MTIQTDPIRPIGLVTQLHALAATVTSAVALLDAAEWSVLTNGDPTTPELVFDSFGDVIMVHVP